MRVPEPSFRVFQAYRFALGLLRPASERQPQRNRIGGGPPCPFQPVELGSGGPAQVADRGDQRRTAGFEVAGQRERIVVVGKSRPSLPELDHGRNIDAGAGAIAKRNRRRGHQLASLAHRIGEHVAALAHRVRRCAQRDHLVARLHTPLVGQHALGATDGTAFSLRMCVHVERLLQE